MPRNKKGGRAANGVGSIRKITTKKNGKEYTYWQGRYTAGYDPGTGKQIQRSVTGKTQKEVAQKIKQFTTEIDLGTYLAPCKLTVGEWLDIWLTTYLGNVKPRTVEIYSTIVEAHLKPLLAAIRLDQLDTDTIQQTYNKLKNTLSAKYIHSVHGVLHKALGQAVAVGNLRTNPASACVLPRVERKALAPLNDLEISLFLKEIEGSPFETLFVVALFTGMRESELLGLTWDCVDFENGTIRVNKQLLYFREEKYVYRLVPTKNGNARLILPANLVIDKLAAYKHAQEIQKELMGSLWVETNLVFTNAAGNHLIHSTVCRHYKRIVAAIGRPDARFHDLRHSYAVASIRAGDDIKTVQGNMGHATAAFTLDVYGHVTSEMRRDSANRMNQYIKSIYSSQ